MPAPLPDAKELMSQLLRQRTTAHAFRLPLAVEDAYCLLYSAYEVEVERRGRTLQMDEDTTRIVGEVAHHLTGPQPNGLLFCGTTGNGKTTLALALQNAVEWLRARGKLPTVFMQYDLDTVRFVEARHVAATYKTTKTRLMSIGVLAIDDVGTEPAEVVDYGNVIEPITELLEARYARGLFTLVTTNLTGQELRQRYGVRLVDRMNEMMHVVVFKNGSFR